ncbi:hypothetical protein [Paenibacillus qinlingensis]|uniref:hypothetical protein n=1 Tax=Paenibacillus qinlingensis TaxID=1837343 RepID=UPI0015645558|nr:hypothetical protein [Paenibacillus qinlingensis]NQX60797.1 hypothetical protein [Paenibacillus qinlingensis]
MDKRIGKWVSMVLVASMVIMMLYNLSPGLVQAAVSQNTGYVSRYINNVEIVNRQSVGSFSDTSFGGLYDFEDDEDDFGSPNSAASNAAPFNAFPWFYQAAFGGGLAGVSVTSIGEELDPNDDDIEFNQTSINRLDGHFIGKIRVSSIPALKKLAEGGTARFMVKVGILNSSSDNNASIWVYTDKQDRAGDVLHEHDGTAYLGWNASPSKWTHTSYADDDEDTRNVNSPWLSFASDDYIIIETETNNASTEVNGIRLHFADIDAPTIANYTFTSDGTERENAILNQQELFLKKDQKLALSYNFSEAVKADAPAAAAHLNSHYLFTNPAGTGLPASGENQGMKLKLTADELKDFTKTLPYEYKASDFHHTGNLPISDGGELERHRLNDASLWEKIDGAEFHDAAGNPLQLDGFSKASSTSSAQLAGKTVNPFDFTSGQGYRVIIDAVPPKYTSVANGIQPDIVTGSTLNKGDVIDFKVQLTEDTIVKEGLNVGGLYLQLNNGMKAYYLEGENTSVWTFRATVSDVDLDVSLLKAIALTHNDKPGHTDTAVIQDYAGNLLMDAANTSKSTNSDPSKSVANTKIDWAKLSIDNTKPELTFRYEDGTVVNNVYWKTAKITIDANDPAITTPALDPDEAGAVRPSRGIYRPLNLTGLPSNSSPGVGLVYYQWSHSEQDPLAGKEADQFAAVKRYSLTGLQPRDGLYPGELPDVNLLVVNNKTNSLLPPTEAFTAENSGTWYLHTWTADMTWDTARELMQVTKMKQFKIANPIPYNGWINEYKAEHPGSSDTDAQTYADGKALEAVGQYNNINLWTPADFNQDDSNWVYGVAAVHLDNKSPSVSAHISQGNNTAVVKARVEASDEHSGIDTSKLLYQWVKAGGQPQEISWEQVPDSGTVSTLNKVIEAGAYQLFVRAVDKAGNRTDMKMEDEAVVNYSVNIHASFSPEPSETYVQSHDIAFAIDGITVGEAVYAFSTSAAAPQADLFQALQFTPAVVDPVTGQVVTSAVYTALKDTALNGVQYVHIRIKEPNENIYYDFNAAFKWDNKAPVVHFSTMEVGYPKSSHTVDIVATELLSHEGMTTRYQWVPTAAAAPIASSSEWKQLPTDGSVTLDNTKLAEGEVVDYNLYIYAIDGAGNGAITHTGAFKLSREENTPIEVRKSDLVYLEGNDVDGYEAIVKAELKNVKLDSYEYAISADNGATWQPWQPYTNFVKVSVTSGKAADLKLKIKFKSASGVVSGMADIDTSSYVPSNEPLYGLASQPSLRPVSGHATLNIAVKPGIRVVPAPLGENPMLPVRTKGNAFEVSLNGAYSFKLTDLTDESRVETLIVVVNNVDNTPPIGTLTYSVIGPTTSNVRVKLSTSEDVRITNNEGRSSYTFTENGSFTFEFEDEAGNAGTATAVVTTIDRAQPTARIVKSYSYGSQGAKTFKTIKNEQDQVILAQGVTLSVEKTHPSDKDFMIVRTPKDTTLYTNGAAEFTIADGLGNTSVVEETITHIVPKLPDPEHIDYQFVDDNGVAVTQDKIVTIGGKSYAKGKMKVTLQGHVDAPNQVFRGTVPVSDGSSFTNLISDANGHYEYAMTYGANGEMRVALTDLLGNETISLLKVEGLDNTAPTIQLHQKFAAIVQNKADFNPSVDLGGYTVADNVSEARNLRVTVEQLDLTQLGRQTVLYTVTDEVGNSSTVKQEVVVLASAGLLIVGNDQIVTSATNESILFDRNEITFTITGYNEMKVAGENLVNERGTYDILYHSGLYREGQMKYIAQKITMDQLLNNRFKVIFPETGWYTIIVRTQEREREFATFFIGKINK